MYTARGHPMVAPRWNPLTTLSILLVLYAENPQHLGAHLSISHLYRIGWCTTDRAPSMIAPANPKWWWNSMTVLPVSLVICAENLSTSRSFQDKSATLSVFSIIFGRAIWANRKWSDYWGIHLHAWLYRLSMGCHTVSPAPVWVRIPGP